VGWISLDPSGRSRWSFHRKNARSWSDQSEHLVGILSASGLIPWRGWPLKLGTNFSYIPRILGYFAFLIPILGIFDTYHLEVAVVMARNNRTFRR